MKYFIAILIVLFASFAQAADYVFHGSWKADNRPIDGPMSCDFTTLGNNKYKAKFYGVWQGVPFEYNVTFSGPPDKLKGTATVDHVPYTWTGSADAENFSGSYTSHRYQGSFAMKGGKKAKK